MKQYIHQLFGIPLSCCHYINCNKWGSVSRARNFFTVSDTQIIPPTSPSPFDNGWSPPVNVSTQQPIPLPPWLRPRHTTPRGSVVQTPLAYHPKHLLYDISYFGTFQHFVNSCQQNAPLLYPRIPFTDFLPEFLWSDWQALVDWNADFNSELTQAILDTVSKLQDFYSNPHIYLPFRLPNLREKARDSELSDLIDATIAEADPPLRTLHNIIGNFFKPSAVLAALGGPDSIRNYVYGDSVPHQWAPSSPDTVESNFKALRIRVINDLINQPHLQKHVSERWFPKKFPKIDKSAHTLCQHLPIAHFTPSTHNFCHFPCLPITRSCFNISPTSSYSSYPLQRSYSSPLSFRHSVIQKSSALNYALPSTPLYYGQLSSTPLPSSIFSRLGTISKYQCPCRYLRKLRHSHHAHLWLPLGVLPTISISVLCDLRKPLSLSPLTRHFTCSRTGTTTPKQPHSTLLSPTTGALHQTTFKLP